MIKLLLASLLLFSFNWFPQQSPNLETCQNVLIYSATTDDGLRYYQLDISQQLEVELPFDNLASAPVWSPDGSQIAIATYNGDGGFDLAVLSDIDDEPVQIASGRATQPKIRWSPDNHTLAFESTGDVFIVNANGSELQKVNLEVDNLYFPVSWSPDGRYLLISSHDFTSSPQIYDVSAHTTFAIYSSSLFEWYYPGAWSPDGHSLPMTVKTDYLSSGIQIYQIETGKIQEVIPQTSGAIVTSISWTPEGDGILFGSNLLSQDVKLHYVEKNGDNLYLYLETSNIRSIYWSPSKTHYTYVVSSSGNQEVFVGDWITGEQVSMTTDVNFFHENYTIPVWSPDGSMIVFEAIDENSAEYRIGVFALNIATKEITRLTSSNRSKYTPHWIPC